MIIPKAFKCDSVMLIFKSACDIFVNTQEKRFRENIRCQYLVEKYLVVPEYKGNRLLDNNPNTWKFDPESKVMRYCRYWDKQRGLKNTLLSQDQGVTQG